MGVKIGKCAELKLDDGGSDASTLYGGLLHMSPVLLAGKGRFAVQQVHF